MRNLTLTNWNRGIAYENVMGGTIENATVLFSEMEGITLDNTSSITLVQDNASLNRVGVAILEGSDYNTLNGVTANGNSAVGIWLYAARDSTVRSSTFEQNNGTGLVLEAESINNTLWGNTADFNTGLHPRIPMDPRTTTQSHRVMQVSTRTMVLRSTRKPTTTRSRATLPSTTPITGST